MSKLLNHLDFDLFFKAYIIIVVLPLLHKDGMSEKDREYDRYLSTLMKSNL